MKKELQGRRGPKKLFGADEATLARERLKTSVRTKPDPKKGYAIVEPSSLDPERVKSFYGGKFPTINGGKHSYPKPHQEKLWLILIAEAMTYRNKKRHHAKHGIKYTRDPKSSQYEYVLYHGRPDQIKRRSKRNRDRRIMLANNIGHKKHEIHHLDSKNLKDPIALTHCEHMKMHGQKCKQPNSPTKAARLRKSQAGKSQTGKSQAGKSQTGKSQTGKSQTGKSNKK